MALSDDAFSINITGLDLFIISIFFLSFLSVYAYVRYEKQLQKSQPETTITPSSSVDSSSETLPGLYSTSLPPPPILPKRSTSAYILNSLSNIGKGNNIVTIKPTGDYYESDSSSSSRASDSLGTYDSAAMPYMDEKSVINSILHKVDDFTSRMEKKFSIKTPSPSHSDEESQSIGSGDPMVGCFGGTVGVATTVAKKSMICR